MTTTWSNTLIGSFGPGSQSDNSWGAWAQTVDLLPVPIDYELKRIHDIIPPSWATRSGANVASLWKEGESLHYKKQHSEAAKGIKEWFLSNNY